MNADRLHVLICVATGRRPEGLARLLNTLPTTEGGSHVDVAVINNGDDPDTHRVVEDPTQESGSSITYVTEPRRGIPFARNACVQAALDRDADALVFIDDDEWPAPGWLDALLATWRRTGADIVLGPAKAALPDGAPAWASRSSVFDKDRRLPDGAPIRTAYSYNTLVSRHALEILGPSFDAAFRHTGASDHHYFKQAATTGLRSVWSPAALVYEAVEPDRLRLTWVFQRGYRIGTGVTRSTRLRASRIPAAARIVALTGANLGRAGWCALRSTRYRAAWVEGIRRLGIALGLVGGVVHRYEEYARRTETT